MIKYIYLVIYKYFFVVKYCKLSAFTQLRSQNVFLWNYSSSEHNSYQWRREGQHNSDIRSRKETLESCFNTYKNYRNKKIEALKGYCYLNIYIYIYVPSEFAYKVVSMNHPLSVSVSSCLR